MPLTLVPSPQRFKLERANHDGNQQPKDFEEVAAGSWQVVRISGDHHHSIVVPHPKKDLPRRLARRIYKDAGWRS
jgi:hypothetical protein